MKPQMKVPAGWVGCRMGWSSSVVETIALWVKMPSPILPRENPRKTLICCIETKLALSKEQSRSLSRARATAAYDKKLMNCRIAIFLNFLIALGSQAFYFSNVPAVPTSRTFQVKVKASEIDFWDWKNVPLNTFTANSPLTARVRAIHQLVSGKELGDIFHVRLGHDDKFDFWEGQSCGILPPGWFLYIFVLRI